MKLPRLAGVAAILISMLLWAGCGDVFRPVANPITGPGGDPQNRNFALMVSQGVAIPVTGVCADGSAAPCVGAATQINVSGDTNLGEQLLGHTPVFATLLGLNAFILNQADNTITGYLPEFSGSINTITLPSGSGAVTILPVNFTPTGTSTAVNALFTADAASNSVSVVNPTTSTVTKTVPVGTLPVALAATSDGLKVYVVNQGANDVTVISSTDNTVLATIPLPSGESHPVAALSNPTTNQIYVLNSGSSSISIIDPNHDAFTSDRVALPAGANSDSLTLDSKLLRLYVTNPGANSISVFDASTKPPAPLPTVSGTSTRDVPLPAGSSPTALAVLPDTTRVYVVNAGATTGCGGEADMGQVSVISTSNNAVTKCITVGKTPVSVAASAESTKVYVAHQGATLGTNGSVTTPQGTTVIATSNDKAVVEIGAPFADPSCTAEDANLPAAQRKCVRMVPVLVIGGH